MADDPRPNRRDLLRTGGTLAAGALSGGAWPEPSAAAAEPAISADDVREAIEWGASYLKGRQLTGGSWPGQPHYRGGLTSLCTLALLHAGYDARDSLVKLALEHLRTQEPKATYATSLQTMVFCAAEPSRDIHLILRNAKWLQAKQIKAGPEAGMWATPELGSPDHVDSSMTHFAMLALHEAERQGAILPDELWRLALRFWHRTQNADGSWGWGPGHPGTGSMTCAGIAALIIASRRLTSGDALVDGEVVRCCREQKPHPQLEKALDWLEGQFSVRRNPASEFWHSYYLYALERAGRMLAQRFIGRHDWYREGARALVAAQRSFLSGAWPADKEFKQVDDLNVSTSFSLMFLAKGRWPVLLGHLRHQPKEGWNAHRNALFNLVNRVEHAWERNLSHQVIDLERATVEELLESPVLFLSGRQAPKLAVEQQQKLRRYVDRGGFLLAVRNCEGEEFDRGFRQLMADLFPEAEAQLKLLPPDHPAWRLEQPVDAELLPELWGIDVGCRTGVIYCPEDLTCYWELDDPGRERGYPAKVRDKIAAARGVGLNVLAYATNREVKYKNPALPGQTPLPAVVDRSTLRLAGIVHAGGCSTASAALGNLTRLASERFGLLPAGEPGRVELTDPSLFQYPIVFLNGRSAFQFTAAERQQLQAYLERGGTLFADAICGNAAFGESLRAEMRVLFPDRPLERIPVSHRLFSPRGGGETIHEVSRRASPQAPGVDPRVGDRVTGEPQLEGIVIDGRLAVIFSPLDVSCALAGHESPDCLGYVREDAARIAINVLFYCLHP